MAGAVGVVGAGSMGAGIAQVALAGGEQVWVYDADPVVARRTVAAIIERLRASVRKGRLTAAQLSEMRKRLAVAERFEQLSACRLVVEAVVESLDVKRQVFADLESVVGSHCILATNTSSLSVSAIAAELATPARFLGLHFFNPAPVMALVEVVEGAATSTDCLVEAESTVRAWGKTPIRVVSSPGFVVNRVARPYYGEAMRLIEECATDPATVDALLVEGGGFRLGPCALTDLIGQDISVAVNQSVWQACGFDARYAPSTVQKALVESGRLGRKSGRGFFGYAADAEPSRPVTEPTRSRPYGVLLHGPGPLTALVATRLGDDVLPDGGGDIGFASGARLILTDGRLAEQVAAESGRPVVLVDCWNPDVPDPRVAVSHSVDAGADVVADAVGLLQACGLTVSVIADVAGLVLARTVAMLANEAAELVLHGVAGPVEIDVAMRLATNYPMGPLEWAGRLGPQYLVDVLDNLAATYGNGRYRASPLLRRSALAGVAITDLVRRD